MNRRDLLRGGAAGAAGLIRGGASPAPTPGVYRRIGVRPFINLKAAFTIDGGLLTLPEVKQAMEAASYESVNLDELMAQVGVRLGKLFGAEFGIVSSGGAGSLTLATAACAVGGNTELMQFLPRVDEAGLKSEVVMPRASRNEYDHAIRAVGVRIVNVETREQFRAALGPKTAMVCVLGSAPGTIPLEQMIADARAAGVPLLIDASPEVPRRPDPYLSRGVDMVSYSGGKYLCGPQCTGFLLGRKELVQAAWFNSSPHHGLNRTLKVGKEEIMGALAAIETFFERRNYEQERRQWETWLAHIGRRVQELPGIRTELLPPPGVNPHPVLNIEWDMAKYPVTADELHRMFLEGEPRLMTHAEGEGNSFIVRAAGMKPGDEKLVADRMHAVFVEAGRRPKPTLARPVMDVAGNWSVEIHFFASTARHRFELQTAGNQVSGSHAGQFVSGKLRGTVDGAHVVLRSELPFDSIQLPYNFHGRIENGRMSGEVDLEEHGTAAWSAVRS